MSKNLILGAGAIVALVLIYFGVVSLSDRGSVADQSSEKSSVTQDSNSVKTSAKKDSFADYMKDGGSYKCTISQNVNGASTSGITYISNGMIRGEYSSQVQGMSINTFFIARDGFTYTWNSMMPNSGYKAKIVTSTEVQTSAPVSASYSFNAETIGEYNCEAWMADMSKFTIPTSVTFQTI